MRCNHGRISAAAHFGRTREYWNAAGIRNCLRGGHDHAAHTSRSATTISRAVWIVVSDSGDCLLPDADVFPAGGKLGAPCGLAGDWPGDLLQLRNAAQPYRDQGPRGPSKGCFRPEVKWPERFGVFHLVSDPWQVFLR